MNLDINLSTSISDSDSNITIYCTDMFSLRLLKKKKKTPAGWVQMNNSLSAEVIHRTFRWPKCVQIQFLPKFPQGVKKEGYICTCFICFCLFFYHYGSNCPWAKLSMLSEIMWWIVVLFSSNSLYIHYFFINVVLL